MSERSIYLRDQAEQCRLHAKRIGNAETQAELLELSDQYLEKATEIERATGPLPPTLWFTEIPAAETPAE